MQKMGNFGQVINENEDCIISLLRPRKSGDEVHIYVIPLPLRNLKWLKYPCRLLVLCLHSPAHITLGHKPGNIPLHTSPPKALLEILIHLGATGVDRQLGIMGLLHDDLSEISLLGNNSSLLKHHGVVTMH